MRSKKCLEELVKERLMFQFAVGGGSGVGIGKSYIVIMLM